MTSPPVRRRKSDPPVPPTFNWSSGSAIDGDVKATNQVAFQKLIKVDQWGLGLPPASLLRYKKTELIAKRLADVIEEDPGICVAIRPLLLFANLFGLLWLENTTGNRSAALSFRWTSLKSCHSYLLVGLMLGNVVMSLMFSVYFDRDFVDLRTSFIRLNYTVYNISAAITTLLCLDLTRHLPALLVEWDRVANRLAKYRTSEECQRHLPTHRVRTLKVVVVLAVMTLTGFGHTTFRHAVSCIPPQPAGFQAYLSYSALTCTPQIQLAFGLSLVPNIFGYVFALWVNFVWNFRDTFIVVMCMALRSNFKIVARHLAENYSGEERLRDAAEWRVVREDHIALCQLVNRVDRLLSIFILMSYAFNFYHVCLDTYSLIRTPYASVAKTSFRIMSLTFFMSRVAAVTFVAASINTWALKPLKYLYRCPWDTYNEEVLRFITHLKGATISVSAYKLFEVEKSAFLNILGTIFTYQLILLGT